MAFYCAGAERCPCPRVRCRAGPCVTDCGFPLPFLPFYLIDVGLLLGITKNQEKYKSIIIPQMTYRSAEVLTHGGHSQIRGSMIQHGNWRELPWANRLRFERILQRLRCAGSRNGEGQRSGPAPSGDRCRARWRIAIIGPSSMIRARTLSSISRGKSRQSLSAYLGRSI